MRDFIKQMAIDNVWCSPFQDAQATIALTRMTKHSGVRGALSIQYSATNLPTPKDNYHVYQIGQNSPLRFALTLEPGVWYRISDICVQQFKLIDLYTELGVSLGKSECYLMLTRAKSFILACRIQKEIVDLNYANVYLKLYTNAYFKSARSQGVLKPIDYLGGVAKTQMEVLSWQQAYRDYDSMSGKAFAFINGRLVGDFPPNSYRIGDQVEWIYDASVREIVNYPLYGLPTFQSTMDAKSKYLLHPPKSLTTIDYRDDLQIYICCVVNDRLDGVLLLRHQDDAVRQLTHRDHSVSVALVQSTITNNPHWSADKVFIKVCYRHSGYSRPLVNEHSRIKELYRLSDLEIIRALVGVDSTITEWSAARLEQGLYPKVMGSLFKDFTPDVAALMFGYNSLSGMVGQTPHLLVAGEIKVPLAYQQRSTAFEYDQHGRLVGTYYHENDGDTYIAKHPDAKLVEFIEGIGRNNIGLIYDFVAVERDPLLTQKVYVCKIIQGVPDQQWFEVTSNLDFVTVVNNRLVWVGDSDRYARVVKSNLDFTLLHLPFAQNQALIFNVWDQHAGNPLYLAPAKLDVWLNGFPLVESIDYWVQWPLIAICNKEYRVAGQQTVSVRAYGFGNSDGSRPFTAEVGYVTNGDVSLDNRYRTRNDRVLKCVVAGGLRLVNQVNFAEDEHQVNMPSTFEGKPYCIDDYLVPIRGALPYTSYPGLEFSQVMDERISDYLNRKLPEHQHDTRLPITQRWALASPAMTKLLLDFVSGVEAPITAAAVDVKQAFAERYAHLLGVDPCKRGYDSEYAQLIAHPFDNVLNISLEQYRFCEWFNRYYLNNQLDLTPTVGVV